MENTLWLDTQFNKNLEKVIQKENDWLSSWEKFNKEYYRSSLIKPDSERQTLFKKLKSKPEYQLLNL